MHPYLIRLIALLDMSVIVFKDGFSLICDKYLNLMRGSRKFCQRESNFDAFLANEEWEDPNTTISGPPSARQRSAI